MSHANSLIHEYTVSDSMLHKQAHTQIAYPEYIHWQGLNTGINCYTVDMDYMLRWFQCLDSTNVELFVWLCACISVVWSTVVCYLFKELFRPSGFEKITFCCKQMCSISLSLKCVYILSVIFCPCTVDFPTWFWILWTQNYFQCGRTIYICMLCL